MIIYPEIDELVKKVGSKYLLVAAASKRARQLKDGVRPLVENPSAHKPVGIAIEEIYAEKVVWRSMAKEKANKEGK